MASRTASRSPALCCRYGASCVDAAPGCCCDLVYRLRRPRKRKLGLVMKRKWVLIGVCFVTGAGAVAGAIVGSEGSSGKALTVGTAAHPAAGQSASAATTTTTTLPAGPLSASQAVTAPGATGQVEPSQTPAGPIATADQATSELLADTAEFSDVTRTAATETTWTGYEVHLTGLTLSPGLQVAPTTPVWVVVAAGKFTPEFGRGRSFAWGDLVYDANTGVVLTSDGGGGSWPSWYSSLPPAANS